jgi:predicted ATPase/DNA-binding SARP family transcriptional activator/regulation of enolase protein 1 (concanavalin A-like superfamily)
MARLSLSLLGPFRATLDGEPITGFASNKVRALLAYLAVEVMQPHPRSYLAGLLWPDSPERYALSSLRSALANLRTAIGDRDASPPFLLISRETIQLNPASDHWIDAVTFTELVQAGTTTGDGLEMAIDLYAGPFMEGFAVGNSATYEDWVSLTRERLQRRVLAAFQRLVEHLEGQSEYRRACEVAWRWVELAPWQERAHQALMRALALNGERASALAQYEACTCALKEELDVTPSDETKALYERIRDGNLGPKEASRRRPDAVARGSSAGAAALVPAALAGENRWVTVLHCKLTQVGTLLDEAGPEVWAKALAHTLHIVEEEIRRYGGEVLEQRTEGAVALFGVPTAHEDDAERAVLAALRMQERIESAPGLRVGVDSGEVFVAVAGERRQVAGHVLALAQRASATAAPGTVALGENAYRLVQQLFHWGDDTEDTIQGVHRPLRRKVEVGKARGVPGLYAPLVGRHEELGALQGAVDRLRAGIGGIVTVIGEAGIGKSRLVAEMREHNLTKVRNPSQGWDLQWVEGRCQSYGGSIAYSLWLDMLRSVLGVPRDAAPTVVRDALRARVQALCPDDLDAVYPYLCRLLSLPLEQRYESVRDLQGESLQAEVFWAVQTLVESAARQHPLVMVCEDLHWADATSLALLERILAQTDRSALLLVCILRPDVAHGCWQLRETAARRYRHRYTDLWLDALTTEESQALVGHLLRIEDLPGPLRANILRHAEGNPFYVEEILRALIDAELIARDDTGHWRATCAIGAIPIPDTLLGVLSARIDRLEAGTRRVLRLTSVIGREFPLRVLAEIVREDDPCPPEEPYRSHEVQARTLERHLLALQQQQLIRERSRVPEVEYVFQHELTREAAYHGLLKQERLGYHRRVAETLQRLYPEQIEEYAGLLAYHWEQAENPRRAVEYLLRAGEQARIGYANAEAIDYCQRALAWMEPPGSEAYPPGWRLSALSGLGKARFFAGQVSAAEAPLREATGLAEEMRLPVRERLRLSWWLGEVLRWMERWEELLHLSQEGLGLLPEEDEALEAALVNYHIAAATSDPTTCRTYVGRTAGFLKDLPYVEELRPVYAQVVYWCLDTKRVEDAQRWVRAFQAQATRAHDLRALADVSAIDGDISFFTGDLQRALPYYRQAVELYGRVNDAKMESRCMRDLAETYLVQGQIQNARRLAERAVELVRDEDFEGLRAWVYGTAGVAAMCERRWDEARRIFEEACQAAQKVGNAANQISLKACQACVCLAQGKRKEASDLIEMAMEMHPPEWWQHLPTIHIYEAFTLSRLEQAYQDPQRYQEFCERCHRDYPQSQKSVFRQWHLVPATAPSLSEPRIAEVFAGSLLPGWAWKDPFGDCSYEVRDGLSIRAANERDVWMINWSAPRLLRPVSGDWAVQAACVPAMDDRPTIGGLLLWKDEHHYLSLIRGAFGDREATLMGCLGDSDVIFGQGCLYNASERILLRLDRAGDQVNAYCSADGIRWYAVGETIFPAEDPLQVGLVAIGHINRRIYPGAHPHGTAIRFESFCLWQQGKPHLA